jgi:hypothetical protein
MEPGSLENLFLHELMDLPIAEKQLVIARPKMAEGVSSEVLRAEHLVQTNHLERLEKKFTLIDKAPPSSLPSRSNARHTFAAWFDWTVPLAQARVFKGRLSAPFADFSAVTSANVAPCIGQLI